MTNFEKIKKMSVEEMAMWIANGISSEPCDYCSNNEFNCNNFDCYNVKTKEIIGKWLKSEAKE